MRSNAKIKMSLEINRPCYEVDFTSKSVSEQLKADDVLLQNQRLNSATKKSKEKRSFTESSARATFQGYEPGVSPNADNSKANFTQNNKTKQVKNKHKVARI